MNLFYSKNIKNKTISLSKNESHHCINVFRNNIGDNISVLDGNGNEYTCEIIDFHNKEAKVEIIKTKTFSKNFRYLHLIISPTKSKDRIEWFVEKSTEIGVDKISFIKTERTERSKINMDRINKIAISAMKQSGQHYLPDIYNIASFNNTLLENTNEDQLFIAHLNDKSTEHLANLYTSQSSCCILIGPEGDFTKDEVDIAVNSKFIPISLGSSTLRTETAGIYALSIINTLNESRP